MDIPKYIIALMMRSRFYYDFESLNTNTDLCAVGYTLLIPKASIYSQINSLNDEVEKLKKWVERQTGGVCHIIRIPKKTQYGSQSAIVTIFDPVMKYLEPFIAH